MQIQGRILLLPDQQDSPRFGYLPVPWTLRAPLGFTNSTSVNIYHTTKGGRPVGDILASVVDLWRLQAVRRITILQDDRPGVIWEVLSKIPKSINIALLESASLNSGSHHFLDLFLEPGPIHDDDADTKYEEAIIEIEKLLNESAPIVGVEVGGGAARDANPSPLLFVNTTTVQQAARIPVPYPPLNINSTSAPQRIVDGWLEYSEWHQKIREQYPDLDKEVDIGKIIVSGETNRRFIRYTFPRYGTMAISVKANDLPGSVRVITEEFYKSNLNILSSLVRRGGNEGRARSEFIAICEPSPGFYIAKDQENTYRSEKLSLLKDCLENSKSSRYQSFGFNLQEQPAIRARHAIYAKKSSSITVEQPLDITAFVNNFSRKISRDHKRNIPVFIAQRFHPNDTQAKRQTDEVKRVLEQSGCVPIIATPIVSIHGPRNTWMQVQTKLWMSKACIAIVFGSTDLAPELAGPSLSCAQEYGYMLGQGKPTTLLIPKQGLENALGSWPNVDGEVKVVYDSRFAFDRGHPESIEVKLKQWLNENVLIDLDGPQ